MKTADPLCPGYLCRCLRVAVLASLCTLALGAARAEVVLRGPGFEYAISPEGTNLRFLELAAGPDEYCSARSSPPGRRPGCGPGPARPASKRVPTKVPRREPR